MTSLVDLLRDDRGATAVEYALIASAIAALIVSVVYVLGRKTTNLFNNVQSAMP